MNDSGTAVVGLGHPLAVASAQVTFIDPVTPSSGASLKSAGLLGEGRLELAAHGLRIVGKQPKGRLPTVVAVIVGLLGVALAGVALVAADLERHIKGSGKAHFLVAFFVGIVPGFMVRNFLRRKLPGVPVDVTVPLGAVRPLTLLPHLIEVVVEGQTLSGALSIEQPDATARALLEKLGRP